MVKVIPSLPFSLPSIFSVCVISQMQHIVTPFGKNGFERSFIIKEVASGLIMKVYFFSHPQPYLPA